MILALIILGAAFGWQARSAPPLSIQQHMERAERFLREGDAEAAAREFQAILATHPDNVDARVDLGVLAYFHHDCGMAVPNLRKAISQRPGLFKAQALLGLCEKAQGDFDGAARDLQQSLPHLRDQKLTKLVATQLIEIYYDRGDLNRAADLLAKLQQAHPTDQNILFMVYRVHTELAERARDALALLAPDSARMHELMAEQFVNMGDAADSIAEYKEALAKDPALPGLHYELGEAIMQGSISADSLERAEQEFRSALKENPNNAGAHAKLGRIAMLRGNRIEAQQAFRRALTLDPSQIDALKGMGEVYARRGDEKVALQYFLQASQSAPLDKAVRYQLASIYRKLGRTADADRELAEFRKLSTIEDQTSLAKQRAQH